MIRLVLIAVGIIPLTILYWFIIFFFTRWWPYSRFNNLIIRTWSGYILKAAGVKIEVENVDTIKNAVPAIIVGNHQSQFDVVALAYALPIPVRFLAKKELFKIPFFGGGMKGAGIIPIDRQNRTKAIESIRHAEEVIRKHKLGIVAFPEGTRSPDGEIRKFKKGPFILAINTQLPIVPVSISGTRFIMKKGTAKIRAGKIKIVIHEPIQTTGLTLNDRDELLEKVRNVIISGYDHYYGEKNYE
jgi:1-acyl-sn-glycerol-3-phosphate acyltransferase